MSPVEKAVDEYINELIREYLSIPRDWPFGV